MMRKNRIKFMITMLIIIFTMFVFHSTLATDAILGNNGHVTPNLGDGGAIAPRVNTILGVIRYIGYTIAIGMLLCIGIKYMMSAANERAELKKGAVNYIIGAIMIGAVTTIVSFLMSVGNGSIATNEQELLKKEWQETYQNYPDYEYSDWLREVKGIK